MYRNPIHVDVFRVLPGRSATKVTWLKDDSKKVVNEALDALKSSTSPDVTPGAPGVGSKGGGGPNVDAVQSGEAGIAGLARALGQKEEVARETGEKGVEQAKKKQKTESGEGDKTKVLEDVLKKRKVGDGGHNVLRLGRDASGGSKKKKKKKKSKKEEKKEKESSGSDSETSSSSSLFHLAALPKGVDRLHRLHEERPGAIANATLRRFNVLLNQSVGRGAAEVTEDLPPVARGYMSQISPEQASRGDAWNAEPPQDARPDDSPRPSGKQSDPPGNGHPGSKDQERGTLCESRTLGTGEPFGAGSSGRRTAGLLPGGDQGGPSRTESGVADAEGAVATPLWQKDYRTPQNPVGEKGEEGEKGDRAPANPGGQEKGKKGKGKGKKGKRKR